MYQHSPYASCFCYSFTRLLCLLTLAAWFNSSPILHPLPFSPPFTTYPSSLSSGPDGAAVSLGRILCILIFRRFAHSDLPRVHSIELGVLTCPFSAQLSLDPCIVVSFAWSHHSPHVLRLRPGCVIVSFMLIHTIQHWLWAWRLCRCSSSIVQWPTCFVYPCSKSLPTVRPSAYVLGWGHRIVCVLIACLHKSLLIRVCCGSSTSAPCTGSPGRSHCSRILPASISCSSGQFSLLLSSSLSPPPSLFMGILINSLGLSPHKFRLCAHKSKASSLINRCQPLCIIIIFLK